MKREIIRKDKLASCYFRSSVDPPHRKALLQITERCNLNCAHCFVFAGNYGRSMPIELIRKVLIPKLKEFQVISVTLTGGEPFLHNNLLEIIKLLRNANIEVSICTNGTLITQKHIEKIAKIGKVRFNVSLDGFSPESHGKFRGDKKSFAKTTEAIRLLGEHRLLKGLLVTPNNLTKIEEYVQLCKFAIKNNATYVLMNPLSKMGRGEKSLDKLRSSNQMMRKIKEITLPFCNDIQIIYIRFPNDQGLPLLSCEAGNIIYIFTNGEVAICPYLVFSARTSQSLYKSEEFIIGNIFKDFDVKNKLDKYKFQEKHNLKNNSTCRSCFLERECGGGCPATIVYSGQKIGNIDYEACPLMSKSFNNVNKDKK